MPSVRPSAGRPTQAGAARRAILHAADRLFYERGISNVSLDAIATYAGVTRRTLYYHFSGKDQLVIAHLALRDTAIHEQLQAAPTILSVFHAIERLFCKRDYKGCALTNAVFETGETAIITGKITKRHKQALLDWFIAAAQNTGALQPRVLGESLMLLFDGLLLSARTRRDPKAVAIACDAAERLIRAHGGNPERPLMG